MTVFVLAAVLDLGVPFVPQEKNTCAAASLAMILRYWGHEVAAADIAARLLEPELKGIRGSRLAAFAREREVVAIVYKGDVGQLRSFLNRGRPLIVAWKVGRDRYHDVVVVGVDDERHEVLVNDPAEGASRRVSALEFERRWRGAGYWTLLVLPAAP